MVLLMQESRLVMHFLKGTMFEQIQGFILKLGEKKALLKLHLLTA